MTNVANVQVNGQLIVRLIKGKQPIYFLPEWPMLRTTPAGNLPAAVLHFHFHSGQIPELAETPRLVISMEMWLCSPLRGLYGESGEWCHCTMHLPYTLGMNLYWVHARSRALQVRLEQFSENFYLHCAVCAATE